MRHVDVAIVGCGPAGIAASIQLTRSGVKTLVFEKNRIGGLLVNAHRVENYPGFPRGITGQDLVRLMQEHLSVQSVEVVSQEVLCLDISGEGLTLTAPEESFQSTLAIVATGTKPKSPDSVEIHPAALGRVFYEISPIMRIENRRIAIYGAGDAAFDYALTLGQHNKVRIINRTDRTRCLPILFERAADLSSIEYLDDTVLMGLEPLAEDGLRLRCNRAGEDLRMSADYVVFAIGREPQLDFLADRVAVDLVRLREEGLLHLIGDVRRGMRRQTAIAVGDGLMAAMAAFDKLEELRG
jgi:thioredoxin reductase (NADPH)